MTDLQAHIEQLVSEKLAGTECFPVAVKVSPNRVLVTIDRAPAITIAECAQVHRFLAETLEPEGVWEKRDLEVSSPGMDQPLLVYQQYTKRQGNKVSVKTTDGAEHTGVMQHVEEKGIELLKTRNYKEGKKKLTEETKAFIPFSEITETKIVFDINFRK
jgi:ribosome maturation factor RimP